MVSTSICPAAVLALLAATVGCTVKSSDTPPLSGPSGLAVSLKLNAIPDSISQNGSDQSSVKITVIGPDGKGMAAVPLRVDMAVNGTAVDFGTLSARSIVTNSDGVASVVYTAPPAPPNGAFTPCTSTLLGGALPGQCVTIIATPTATNFQAVTPETVVIRLVPIGVILPPASAPTPSFVAPVLPSANSPATFDASLSCGAPLGGSPVTCPATAPAITSYAWNFGDGQTGNGRTVSHSFALQQTYTVTLTVTNASGAFASTSQVVAIGAGSLPTASFTFSPTLPAVGELVFFNGQASTPGVGHTVASYRWTFGDGQTGTGQTVSHAFATAGTYVVQLVVMDEAGQSSLPFPNSQVTIGNAPVPTAEFKFSPDTPYAVNQAITFDASLSKPAVGPGGTAIVSYSWTWGDGTAPQTTSLPTISHTFGFGGFFNVTLVVRDASGRASVTATHVFNAVAAVACGDATLPCALITASPAPASVNKEVSFLALVSSVGTTGTSITNYQWDFGDGSPVFSTGTAANIGYTYRRTGAFTVKLTVTNNGGRTSSSNLTVLVQ